MYFEEAGFGMGNTDMANISVPGVNEEYVLTQCILADGGDRFGVCALAFDRHQELIWMGNQGGHVTSYYTSQMQKYTSFQVHGTQDVRQILPIEEGVLSLTASSMRFQLRRGVPLYTHCSPNMTNMQCMLQLSRHRIVMAGHQDKLIEFNLGVYKETNVMSVGETGCVTLRGHNRFICAGNQLGRIDLWDPNTLAIENSFETHSGSLSDFDVQDNLLVTCGFSNRQGTLSVDRFLRLYDLRMMRSITPIQTMFDPLYVRFLPSGTQRLAVVSASGQAQLIDTVAFTQPRVCILQTNNPSSMCLSFDISTSCQAIAFGDSAGYIHMFTSQPASTFNTFSAITEQPDPIPSVPGISMSDASTPYSMVPMPTVHPELPLASDWPSEYATSCYRQAIPVPEDVLVTIKMQGPIGYGPNPNTMRRNQVPYNVESNDVAAKNKALTKRNSYNKQPASEEANFSFKAIPKRYRKIDVKYNKLGAEEFQFDQYNKTGLTGLEAQLPNAYCNAMLQVLYYMEPLRAVLLSHICHNEFCLSCEMGFLFHMLSKASSVPCQAGNFLRAFRTVPEASALGLILNDMHPDAKDKLDLGGLIQSWNRFILHQMHVELVVRKKAVEEAPKARKPFVYKEIDFPAITSTSSERKRSANHHDHQQRKLEEEEEKKEDVTEVSELFGMKQFHINCCLTCTHEVRKESVLFACNLNFPTSSMSNGVWSFCDILKRSLNLEQVTPAWCDVCKRFSSTWQSRRLKSLPKLLSINTNLNNSHNKTFWREQTERVVAKAGSPEAARSPPPLAASTKPCRYGDYCSRLSCRFRHSFDVTPVPTKTVSPHGANNWLPHRIRISLTDNDLNVQNVEPTNKQQEGASKYVEYMLTAAVCNIFEAGPTGDKKSLVALIKIPPIRKNGTRERTMLDETAWYLFNDFCITPVPAQEVTWFSMEWKVPCVLYYSTEEVFLANTMVVRNLNKEIFSQAYSVVARPLGNPRTFTPLTESEYPRKGDLVAMDAEFVTLIQEESELRSGKMSTVKPSHLSVARITCIRGQGPYEGTPFIDDYISTQEQVVDYLTKFSGIKPGDLDANFSSKNLTTLKSTYIKLRFLQDSGVIFVGHGLKNDFRVINLVIPPEQVVDTVQLFHLPHQRMISLRFLAWHFLGLNIQSETHDSTEDARTALQLYRCYKQLQADNKVAKALADLYEVGKCRNWKVPDK